VSKRVGKQHSIYQYSLRGLWKLARSKVIFVTHGSGDIPYFKFSFQKKFILLWHAISFKKTVTLDTKMGKKNKRIWKEEIRKYSFIISSSDIDRYAKSCCLGVNVEKVKITGIPGDDILYEILKGKKPSLPYEFLSKKIILYAPTFKENKKIKFFPFPDFNLFSLNNFLSDKNIYILLRTHYKENTFCDIEKDKFLSERIIFANWTKFEDVQELLPFVDILITDYSSIFLDFLILKRPIIFIPYDAEDFFKTRQLLYDYEIITPGPKIKTQKELITWVEKFLANSEEYKKEREILQKLFHKFNDGYSYRRIYKLLKNSL